MANDLVAAKLRSYWLCLHEQLPYDQYDEKSVGKYEEEDDQEVRK
jgi:hypothetical protein